MHSVTFAQIKFPKGDIYTHNSGQKIAIPNRSLAVVDVVDSISIPMKKNLALIGEPNFKPDRALSTAISLPPNESLILRFTNNKIRNIKDKDLCVFNIGGMKRLSLFVEKENGEWLTIGTVSNENPCLYIVDELMNDTSFTRLKLLNTSHQTILIDAVAAIGTSGERELKKLSLDDFQFSTSNSYITLKYKDYRQWDGDKIKITVNGETVIPQKTLAIWWRKIRVVLNEGENSINITALNNGITRPNTAQLRIYDGEKRYETLLRLRKRTQKTIFIERE